MKDQCGNDRCHGFPCEGGFNWHTCNCGACECSYFFTNPTKCWPGMSRLYHVYSIEWFQYMAGADNSAGIIIDIDSLLF